MSMVAPLRARVGPDDVLWSCPRMLFYYSEYRSNPSSYLKPTGPSPMLYSFTIQKLKLSAGSEPPWFSPSYLWENPRISLQTRVDLGALLKDFHQFIIIEHKTTPNTLNYQPERQVLCRTLPSTPRETGHLLGARLEGKRDGGKPWWGLPCSSLRRRQLKRLWLEYSKQLPHHRALVLTAGSVRCCFDSLKQEKTFFMKEFKLYALNQNPALSHFACCQSYQSAQAFKIKEKTRVVWHAMIFFDY